MESKSRWEAPCSDCSAQLAGKRSSADAHEYLMRTASQPCVYECLICGSMLGRKDTAEWHAIQSVAAAPGAGLQREHTAAASDGHRAG